MVWETYRFDDGSYQAIADNGVVWEAIMHVLRNAHPRIRRHFGEVLHIAAPAPDGQWIVVALIEEADDTYLVVSARYLDGAETEAARKLLEGGTHDQS